MVSTGDQLVVWVSDSFATLDGRVESWILVTERGGEMHEHLGDAVFGLPDRLGKVALNRGLHCLFTSTADG